MRSNEVGYDGLGLFILYLAVGGVALGGEFDVVLVADVQIEGREGKIIFTALAIIYLIYL